MCSLESAPESVPMQMSSPIRSQLSLKVSGVNGCFADVIDLTYFRYLLKNEINGSLELPIFLC